MDIQPQKLTDLIKATNVAELLQEDECDAIAAFVMEGFDTDEKSRADWKKRTADQIKLAMQIVERKTEPWDGCSNVKFPLVTIAVQHYVARAYPLLVNNNDLVKMQVFGTDSDGVRTKQATRVGEHMTWQNMEQMPEWEEEHEKVLVLKGIIGTAYKKRYFDPVLRRQVTVAISPADFVVNYFTRGDINLAPRATYKYELYPNDIRERVVRKVFCDTDGELAEGAEAEELGELDPGQALPDQDDLQETREMRTGELMPQLDTTAPIAMIEQMCWLDLDGDDYAEPYFVTIEMQTGKLRRIVARFTQDDVKSRNGSIISIMPERAYLKYGMFPAPDGSHYGVGFGHLLGPINDSVDTALNQIFDGSTMATLGGGFLGRGARMKAGMQAFKPFEWKQLDSTGDDIRKNVFPLPIREPSNMLLQLITWLVGYGERIASANDIQQGESPGQNTKAETMRTMNENGGRIFAGLFKGDWRSMRNEFRVQHTLNRVYFPEDEAYTELTGKGGMVLESDYQAQSQYVRPAADPNVVSDEQKRQQASMLVARAQQSPGYNRYRAERALLEAYKVPNIDYYLAPPTAPGKDGQPQPAEDYPPPQNPKMLEVQVKQQKLQIEAQRLKMEQQNYVMQLQQDGTKVAAEILELRARSILELAQAKGAEQGPQIAMIDALIGAKKAHMDGITARIDSMTKLMGAANDAGPSESPQADGSGSGGMAQPPGNTSAFSIAGQQQAGNPTGLG